MIKLQNYFNWSFAFSCLVLIGLNAQAQVIRECPPGNGDSLLISPSFDYSLFFREGDTVQTLDGRRTGVRGQHDMSLWVKRRENGSLRNYVYIGHESLDTNSILGDGGGGSMIPMKQDNDQKRWYRDSTKPILAVDFSPVGGTADNCSGTYNKVTRTVLTAEEFPVTSNKALYRNGKGMRDTSDYNGRPRWQQMGWVTEVSVDSAKAIRKIYDMGRFSHESAYIMQDGRTVLLTDDYAPAVLFKYVAEKPNDFSAGRLYAYKEQEGERRAEWIPLPMAFDSLLVCRDIALRKGATAFLRLEWIAEAAGVIYMTETGVDAYDPSRYPLDFPINWARHIREYQKQGDDTIRYPYGALLAYYPNTYELHAKLQGGLSATNSTKHFSNPDGLGSVIISKVPYLIICEDLISTGLGKVVKESSYGPGMYVNEVYLLDSRIKNPTIDDLIRIMVVPFGSEPTGPLVNPDKNAFFINIQHPDPRNQYPFNKSATILMPFKTELFGR